MKFNDFNLQQIKTFAKRYWYIIAILLLAIIAGLSSFVFMNYILKKPPQPPVVQKEPVKTEPPKPEPPKKAEITCPLDGNVLSELPSRRMLAVSIDNSPEARPQSGLKDAELIIELPVEGGITRLLAFYYHNEAAKIGPVRSARTYLIKKAQEYGAVLVHAGQSPQALEYFTKYKPEHIDEMPNTPGFWREKNRNAPHNLYTSSMNMWGNLQKQGLTSAKVLEGLKFNREQQNQIGQDSSTITIFYPFGELEYQYQPVDKDYLRFISGKAHIDAESFLPLRVKNIIIQFAKTKVLDGEGRLSIDFEGEGRAVIVSEGKVIEGTWSKEQNGVTKYLDAQGQEIQLPSGQTWVEVVQENMHIDY